MLGFIGFMVALMFMIQLLWFVVTLSLFSELSRIRKALEGDIDETG